MKMVFFLIPLFGAGTLFGQNLALNNEDFNPPAQYQINPVAVNTDQAAQQRVAPIQMQQKVLNKNDQNVAAINFRQGAHTPEIRQGRASSGNGPSGATVHRKTTDKKSFRFKLRKALRIFLERYHAPKHYGNKWRIRKCHGF